MNAYITGAASFFPNLPVPTQQIERILGQVEGALSPRKKDFLRRISGIQSRYYAIDPATRKVTHSNAQLTAAAIEELLERTGTESSGIDLLACGTSSPDQLIPSHASMVHGILKWPPCEIVSTAGVCCSAMSAMKYALNGLLAGSSKRAVVAGSELASPVLTAKQFEFEKSEQSVEEEVSFGREFLRFMLSDGACAILMEPDSGDRFGLRVDWLEIRSFANELEACMYSGASKEKDGSLRGWRMEDRSIADAARNGRFVLYQDIKLLNENITKLGVRFFKSVMERHHLRADEITWFLPHLSSMWFRKQLHDEMAAHGVPIAADKWFTNLPYKGNTGSASILVALEECMNSGKFKPGDRIICGVPESARFTYACMCLTAI